MAPRSTLPGAESVLASPSVGFPPMQKDFGRISIFLEDLDALLIVIVVVITNFFFIVLRKKPCRFRLLNATHRLWKVH